MEIAVYNHQGQKIEELKIESSLANLKFNSNLVHQVYRSYLVNERRPLAFTKNRGEVSGGGKKPWPQKGTGRARHASIRSPIWRGGGVVFGPRQKEENLKRKINKKVRKKALAMVLTQKIKDKEVIILDDWNLKEIKTREADKLLKTILSISNSKKKIPSVLIVLKDTEKALKRAFSNLEYVSIEWVNNITIKDLLNHKFIVLKKDTFQTLINNLSKA